MSLVEFISKFFKKVFVFSIIYIPSEEFLLALLSYFHIVTQMLHVNHHNLKIDFLLYQLFLHLLYFLFANHHLHPHLHLHQLHEQHFQLLFQNHYLLIHQLIHITTLLNLQSLFYCYHQTDDQFILIYQKQDTHELLNDQLSKFKVQLESFKNFNYSQNSMNNNSALENDLSIKYLLVFHN